MSLHQHKLQILSILSENLRNPSPQLVSTTAIAGNMDMQLPKLHQVLKTMDGMGFIQIDSDLQHILITREGLKYLGEQEKGGSNIC
jgi:DNA-binding IclR family transcriptional regulator